MASNTCIYIDGREIGDKCSPYFVADLSSNHQQCIEQAKALIKAAKNSGADAVKLQTYTADTVTLPIRNEDFKAKGPWKNTYLYDLYKTNYTPWEWYEDLADYAKKVGITLFSTPFDESAVDFLETTLQPPIYKISSFEINHIPLLKRIAQTGKPVLLSTELASENEINEAIETLETNGCKFIVLLKCICASPANPINFNLNALQTLKSFHYPVGISDCSLHSAIIMGAIALGACIVEKHFVLSRKSDTIDGNFSLEPHEFQQMVQEGKTLYQSLGSKEIKLIPQAEEQKKFRRSIYVSQPIKKGEVFSEKNLKIIRPHFGLHPRYWEKILGQAAKTDLPFGHPLNERDVTL